MTWNNFFSRQEAENPLGQPDMVREVDQTTSEIVADLTVARSETVRAAGALVADIDRTLLADNANGSALPAGHDMTLAMLAQAQAYTDRSHQERVAAALDRVHDAHLAAGENSGISETDDFLDDRLRYAAGSTAPTQLDEPQSTAPKVLDPTLSETDKFFLEQHSITPPVMEQADEPAPTEIAPWDEMKEASEANPVGAPSAVLIAEEMKHEDEQAARLEAARQLVTQIHTQAPRKQNDWELAA